MVHKQDLTQPRNLTELLQDEHTLFVCNHSGGKDSQAMQIMLEKIVPAHRLITFHADLGEVDWPGTLQHIQNTINSPLHVVSSKKTFFDIVLHRGMFPSPKNRQCTSDLKRAPIHKQIKALVNPYKKENQTEKRFYTVVDCVGIRAQESTNRSKLKPFELKTNLCYGRRSWYQWLPVFDLSKEAVFDMIASAGQEPHWAYKEGMSRLSCSFCIMSCQSDILPAARLRPELLKKYDTIERQIGKSMMMPRKGKAPERLMQIVERLNK